MRFEYLPDTFQVVYQYYKYLRTYKPHRATPTTTLRRRLKKKNDCLKRQLRTAQTGNATIKGNRWNTHRNEPNSRIQIDKDKRDSINPIVTHMTRAMTKQRQTKHQGKPKISNPSHEQALIPQQYHLLSPAPTHPPPHHEYDTSSIKTPLFQQPVGLQ